MIQKTNDAISRSDRALVVAMAIVLATASAAIGAGWGTHPSTDKVLNAKPAPVAAAPAAPAAEAPKPATDMVMVQLLAEHRCLSEVLYYEARGEGADGQKAIAEVVFHRMNHGNYGHSICAVVYEGAGHSGCQFSFTCNGDLARGKQPAAWRQSEMLAARILTGEERLRDATGGATNYHAISVTPEWADSLERTTQIGNHIFYRNGVRTRTS
jgi:spore germination cell wall hydrolase CwlJ-like protein